MAESRLLYILNIGIPQYLEKILSAFIAITHSPSFHKLKIKKFATIWRRRRR